MRRKIDRKPIAKIIIILAIIGGTISYPKTANAGLFDEIWNRVQTTVNALKDGIQLEDFRPIVTELLNVVAPGAWQEIEQATGIDVRAIIISGIFEQKLDAIAEIIMARDWAKTTTLSDEGVAKMEQVSNEIGENLQKTVSLGSEIQNERVTQEILKKKSMQEVLGAEREAVLIQQNQMLQIDRAINNQLSSRILDELLSSNTGKHREAAANAINARNTSILISLPGYNPEANNDDNNSSNFFTTNSPIINNLTN